uniref:Uncharacterized protein n=1 Tax=Physcomitrium patens TaxID=3218 RepID=A0A2K1IR74_PHYPA|nr:hypothetical protein PHYPA_025906 [Physcomitrium patens]
MVVWGLFSSRVFFSLGLIVLGFGKVTELGQNALAYPALSGLILYLDIVFQSSGFCKSPDGGSIIAGERVILIIDANFSALQHLIVKGSTVLLASCTSTLLYKLFMNP